MSDIVALPWKDRDGLSQIETRVAEYSCRPPGYDHWSPV